MNPRRIICLLIAIASVLAGGCTTQKREEFRQRRAAQKPPAKVWLVSNGWHTSIALRTQDATKDIQAFAPKSQYLVIGWGGADFYMWRQMDNFMRRLSAILLPTSSALHVIPADTSLVKAFPNSEIIEFEVCEQGLERLRKSLARSFKRDPKGRPLVIGPGKIPQSRFFGGEETYYLPKTCNMWAASKLNTAGVPIRVSAAIVADNLIWQGRKKGKLLAAKKAAQDPL
jgi:uncharacterized protein (TIGR02117 family)